MDQVSQVREKIDIVAFIQEYLPLKKAGRNFKVNCPFHADKTPSFIVSPERQIWHCFSCGKGGDVFTFLMEYDHMEFPEALRILAQKAGVTLQNQKFETGLSSKKEKIYTLNHLAAEFYHYLLTKHTIGKKALEYVVSKRKIKPATLNTYMLGFAPSSGKALVTYLMQKKKYTKEEIIDAGLATPRGADLYDFFQDRLIFPLFDHRDNIIGFSGRILTNNINTSKYINTRETLVYHKGLTFFGLNSAKKSIKEANWAIIMEGEFDVIASFQEGITNAVAVKGTALTLDQVNLLSRFASKISLCFDADSAGQGALKRSVSLLEKKGLTTTVIELLGKDPDEMIKENPIAFKKALKQDIPIYDYLIQEAVKTYDPLSPLGKKQIGDEILPFLSDVQNEIIKEHYLQLLGKTINTSYDSLLKAIEKLQKKEIVKREIAQVRPQALSREEKLEEYLLALILQSNTPRILLSTIADFLQDYSWKVMSYKKIILHLQTYCQTHPDCLGKDAAVGLAQELLPSFDTCFLLPLPPLDDEKWQKEVKKTAQELYVISIKDQMKRLSGEIAQKEKDGTAQELAQLQADFAHFVSLLSKH